MSSGKATRQAFGESLAELGGIYKNIVVLDADLSKSTKSDMFAKAHPDRFFEMGIAEANMIGTAAGLAFAGYRPFLCSFGCFLTGRYDQIRMSVAYSKAVVRMVGTHAGVGIGDDGHSQMGLEDVGLMRGLPTLAVLQPGDEVETREMMKYLCSEKTYDGPVYLRLTRQNLIPVFKSGEYRFELGKMHLVRPSEKGSVAIFATGATLQEALKARDELVVSQGDAFAPAIINVSTIKPLDTAFLRDMTQKYRHWISIEDHSVINGMGSALAEFLAESGTSVKLRRLGIQDQFGESGDPAELYEKFGLSAKALGRVCKVGL